MREWGSDQRDGQLASALAAGQVTLVVGAGVSIAALRPGAHHSDWSTAWGQLTTEGWEGPTQASWPGLLLHGLKFAEEQGVGDVTFERYGQLVAGSSDDLIYLGGVLQEKLQERQRWPDWLQSAFRGLDGHVNKQGDRLIGAIDALDAPTLTTNYDRLLRRGENGSHVSWAGAAAPLAIINGEQADILHLHGDYNDPSSIVLGRRSYDEFLAAASESDAGRRIANALHTAYSDRTLVFTGCGNAGLTDPHFDQLRRYLGALTKNEPGIHHYVLCIETEEETYQGSDRIEPLVIGTSFDDLPDYLEAWARAARQAPTSEQRSASVRAAAPSVRSPLSEPVNVRFEDEAVVITHPSCRLGAIPIDWESVRDWAREASMARLLREISGPSSVVDHQDAYRLLGAHLSVMLGRPIREHLMALAKDVGSDTYLELSFADNKSLGAYPWEYLYIGDPRQGGSLLADDWRFLVRRPLREFKNSRRPRTSASLEMLCVVPNPWLNEGGAASPDVKELEWHATKTALENLKRDAIVDVSYLVHEESSPRREAVTGEDSELDRRLFNVRRDPNARLDVLHLVAHASLLADGPALAFSKVDGTVKWQQAFDVARDVADEMRGPVPGLVLLELDETAVRETPALLATAQEFALRCPNVIAVQHRGDHEVLGIYFETLYRQLAECKHLAGALKDALEAACAEVTGDRRDRRCPPFGIPVVYLSNADVFAAPPTASGAGGGEGAAKTAAQGGSRPETAGTTPAKPKDDMERRRKRKGTGL